MALRQTVLAHRIGEMRSQMKDLETKRDELAQRRSDMDARDAELEAAVNEITDETPQEEKDAVNAEVEKFENDAKALETEETENNEARSKLQATIDELDAELEKLNEKTRSAKPVMNNNEKRKDDRTMNTRKFFGMTMEQRDELFAREDMKSFISTIRTSYNEKRAISNVGLLIPNVLLPILRQVTEENSKMLKHVNLVSVPGTSRQNIMGEIPEAVWTEMCANLNELALAFNNVELDGYKVGGFIAVCNAILEDADDVALASEILNAIGKAIGKALDKAILYGTGTKMPVGIVTRLVQTQAPSNYPATARTWADLHTSNVVSIPAAKTAVALFQAIVVASGAMSTEYGSAGLFWAMNRKTRTALMAEAMTFTAGGSIVSGTNGTMPVIGGDFEELDFIPDNVIIAGFGKQYLLAERAGTQLATSEHVRFVQDQTVFKGTARYDGMPVIPEAFMAIGINGETPTATMTFAADTAND